MRSAPVLAVCLLLGATSATAQTTSSGGAPLPQMFVGAGIGPSTNDAASRMRLFEASHAFVWLIEAGAAVSERVGIGAEYSQPSPATAFTTVGAGRFQSAGRQEEQVLLATLRARVGGASRWAADVVGGAGILFQHHGSGTCVPAQVRCENTDAGSLDERAPAFALGLDVPLRMARHFDVVADARTYFLRRREHTSRTDINLSWQYEWQSSTRTAIGLIGRIVW